MLLGSVIVIVGVLRYPDPGSVILISNNFSDATEQRALAFAPVKILRPTVVVAAPSITIHRPDLFGLPNADAAQVAVVVSERVVQVIPNSEVAACVPPLATATNTPWP